MKLKSIKTPVNRCCDCGRITNIKDLMIIPYSVEIKKNSKKVLCFDCEVKGMVCYG